MAVVPVSVGMTKRQIKLMKDLNATVLCCTPSFAVYLAESMIKEEVDPKEDLKLRIGLFGAETWSKKMRERIEGELALEAYDLYGLTELCGPGISIECSERHGLHIWDDHFFVEVIDPKTGEVLSPEEEGELVFTTLTKTGLPLLRYRTRDVSVLETDKCGCGRTHTRMMRVRGRSDDMFFVKGVNVFPTQIEYVLMGYHQLALQYQIILERRGMDLITVKVELTEEASNDPRLDTGRLITLLKEEIRNVIGIRADIRLVDQGEIPRSMGKAQRVLDLRKNAL
jgi:phenylacetate-CoA ligase